MLIREEPSDSHTASVLESALLDDLRGASLQGENRAIILSLRDETAALRGGLSGATSYGWLLIKLLWVASDLRGQGYGAALVARAERIAERSGCHAAWLDTSSPAAMQFYARLGYAQFGVLENGPGDVPPGHRRWFMQRRLIP